jgi:hypothetical protein
MILRTLDMLFTYQTDLSPLIYPVTPCWQKFMMQVYRNQTNQPPFEACELCPKQHFLPD